MRKSPCGAQRHRGEKSKSRFKTRWAKTKGNGRKSTIYPRKITWHKGRKRHLRGNFIEALVQTNVMGAETVWKDNKTRRDKAPNTEPAPTEKVKINKQMQRKSPIYDQSPVVPELLRSPWTTAAVQTAIIIIIILLARSCSALSSQSLSTTFPQKHVRKKFELPSASSHHLRFCARILSQRVIKHRSRTTNQMWVILMIPSQEAANWCRWWTSGFMRFPVEKWLL